jgi:DNA-binding transcriptional regulator YiaG
MRPARATKETKSGSILPETIVLNASAKKKLESLFARPSPTSFIDGIREVLTTHKRSDKQTLADFRAALGWSRNQLAQVLNASDRAIFNWEAGDPMSPVYSAKFREVQSVYNELKQLMKPEEIGAWLPTEMEEFDGRTPADLISKGETGRVWASLFYLRSGMPD